MDEPGFRDVVGLLTPRRPYSCGFTIGVWSQNRILVRAEVGCRMVPVGLSDVLCNNARMIHIGSIEHLSHPNRSASQPHGIILS